MRLFLVRLLSLAGLALVVLLAVSGCRSEECIRMKSCCDAVKDVEGVGEACGPRAQNVSDARVCKTILETIGYMFENRDKKLPKVCKIDDES